MALSVPHFQFLYQLKLILQQQPQVQNLILQAQIGTLDDWTWQDELLYYKGKIYIPDSPELKHLIFQEFHTAPVGGHAGIQKTFHRISASFYWPLLRKEVEHFVKHCLICHQIKPLNKAPCEA